MRIFILYICSLFFVNTSYTQNDLESLDSETLELILEFGKTYKGRTYFYGGCNSSQGFDCSGFIYYIFKMAGYNLPRSSRDIYKIGKTVDLALLKKGDLLFFNTLNTGTVSHVGIVSEINDKQIIMLHVSSSKGVQEIDIISSDYWYNRLVGSKTIL